MAMKDYTVTFLDRQGKRRKRTICAASFQEARSRLRQGPERVLSIQEYTGKNIFSARPAALSGQTLAFFFQQLALILQAGIALAPGWRLIASTVDGPGQRRRLEEVVGQMENGLPPSAAMEQSRLFPTLACRIVKVGEGTGNLDEIFMLLGQYYEDSRRQGQEIRNALAYPAFLCFCTILLITGAVWFVVPVFEDMFQQMAIPLPLPTRYLIKFQRTLQDWLWLWLPLLGVAMTAGCACLQSEAGRRWLERLLLRLGYARRLLLAMCWQRFGRLLAIQLSGGIPLLEALEDAGSVIPFLSFQDKVRFVRHHLSGGMPFSIAITKEGIATTYVEAMLAVGEAAGEYDKALYSISTYYAWELSVLSRRLQKLLGPAALVLAGGAIGLVVLCLLLPLLDSISSLQL